MTIVLRGAVRPVRVARPLLIRSAGPAVGDLDLASPSILKVPEDTGTLLVPDIFLTRVGAEGDEVRTCGRLGDTEKPPPFVFVVAETRMPT
jgi:hypothetical protein